MNAGLRKVLPLLILVLIAFAGGICAQNAGSQTGESAEVHRTRARELEKQGEVDEAIDEYLASLEIEPNSIEIQHHVGALLEQPDERELAFEHYKAAASLMEQAGQTRTLADHTDVVRQRQ